MSDFDTPRVSVLLPVYNGAPFIVDAVQSIRAQSFTDFELLILTLALPTVAPRSRADVPKAIRA